MDDRRRLQCAMTMTTASPATLPQPGTVNFGEEPWRGESFSLEHLEQHAEDLAAALGPVVKQIERRGFISRVAENAKRLRWAHRVVSEAVRNEEVLNSDAEWLLDNFSVVEEQLREIEDDLPRSFYRELPKLADGAPRIFFLARELIVHTDSALDEETILRFVRAFQRRTTLSIGEVWAFPIMLRLGLVENLRRLADQMLAARECRAGAASLIKAWTSGGEFSVDLSAADRCAPLVLELIEQLQELGAEQSHRLTDLEQRLTERGLHAADVIRIAHQRQAANQVSIGNVITSMRLISALDWMQFFESTNLAEQVLRRDPARIYSQMDSATRDRYRHVVEDLAKCSDHDELEVAEAVLALARHGEEHPTEPAERRHVGYFLIDEGREQLEASLACRLRVARRLELWLKKHATGAYLGSIGLLTLACLGALASLALAFEASEPAAIVMACLAVLPASELAIILVNLAVTLRFRPLLLPKLEFRDGVPAGCATIVVVPSLLTSRREIEGLVQRLEAHYLANFEPALRFALLTDFSDAAAQELPEDEALLTFAVERVAALNRQYGLAGVKPFYLLHRGRRWNEAEQIWMGWERKRGKLVEFNRLLRGVPDTSFETIEGDPEALLGAIGTTHFRYVITLDADTQLPPGTARRLIGAMAHPLNWPRMDARGRVRAGYVILQPRIGLHLGSANRSWFSRIFANHPGIDPYVTAASDVYQDLFGEGSFTGKGIYELDTFETLLDGVFPENRILSHDLIEGCHTRVGLASDIELIDSYPSRYEAEARRQHRWARGDWQLLPWLLPYVPTVAGWRSNPLSLLSRWKICDNLRRSLVAPALMIFLVVGWIAFPGLALLWTLAGILPVAIPVGLHLALTLHRWPRGVRWAEYRRQWLDDLFHISLQGALSLALLPHRAAFMTDAVLRTLVRLCITRQRMLEWETAAATERRMSKARWRTLVEFWISPALAVVLFVLLWPTAWIFAAPLLVAWLLAPPIAHWISQPVRSRQKHLDAEQQNWLRQVARKTWSFFEIYVGEADHWLPPDNFQEYPGAKIAHRISPTNEGLFLVSALVARDFGFLSLTGLVELWERNLDHWTKLDRLRGHFYNWYDTLTLQPLLPRYVSTVDSGNLLACFYTLQQGIEALRSRPLLSPGQWQGLLDTIGCVRESCESLQARGARIVGPGLGKIAEALDELQVALGSQPNTAHNWRQSLAASEPFTAQLAQQLAEQSGNSPLQRTPLPAQVNSLLRLIQSLATEIGTLFSWTALAPDGSANDTSPTWPALAAKLAAAQDLVALRNLPEMLSADLAAARSACQQGHDSIGWERLDHLEAAIVASAHAAAALDDRFRDVAERCEALGREMDFTFLYNPQRKLFSIGFNLEDGHLDRAHYDMLASEARLASYLAIAKGDVDYRHWFRMSRALTQAAGQLGLLSWGGTMFEYLMPQLFQRSYEGSLLAERCRMAVARQIQYGRQQGVPWGVSESAFGALAANSDYHYRSFGVPGLGLKRGLAKDLVVSPYSTLLALEVDPQAACENLQLIAHEGGLGPWGFYDALDYSTDRVPAGQRCQVVRCYMAHHQGMSLVALGNLLHEGSVRRWFHAHSLGRVAELLLQERLPTAAPLVRPPEEDPAAPRLPRVEDELVSRRLVGYETATPRTHLLSNTHYSVMLTSTGGGYSRCNGVAVSRWRCDATRDHWGQFCYLRDLRSGRVWSATYQPTLARPDSYEVFYSIDKAEYRRRDGKLETHLEVAVSPEYDADVRQLTITNHSFQVVEIEITSYCEVVLTTPAADEAHPAFQKLFVETEYVPEETALLARRRPRDSREPPLWGVHVLAAAQVVEGTIEHETSREAFLGRGRTPAAPRALDQNSHLSGATGAVLDPIFSLRCTIAVPPHKSVSVAFTTALCKSREEALALADQHHDPRGVQRAFELAWAFSQVELRHLHVSPALAHQYQRMASALLYPDATRRAPSEVLLANEQGQSGLWRYGISGDLPILLAHVNRPEQLDFVRELLVAQQFWRSHGLDVDLAIMNDHPGSYLDALQDQLVGLVNEMRHPIEERPPGVFLLRSAQIPRADQVLLDSAAMLVLSGDSGPLARQTEHAAEPVTSWLVKDDAIDRPLETAAQRAKAVAAARQRAARRKLDLPSPALPETLAGNPSSPEGFDENGKPIEFWNGYGGFAKDGREYQIVQDGTHRTPKPWSNVIANPRFGCLVTDSGGGYTWAENSREFKLTSWANDPISDSPSEWLYARDEASEEVWHPLPQPGSEAEGEYRVQHGQGYSRFLHSAADLESTVHISIAPEDPVKFICISLHDTSGQPRRLSFTLFVEWVLGVSREQTQLHIATQVDPETRALLARNAFHPELPNQTAFLHALSPNTTLTGDRAEFVGRNRDNRSPKGLSLPALSGRTGIGLDPGGALQTKISLDPHGKAEVVFLLGAGADQAEVRTLLKRYGHLDNVRRAMERTTFEWDRALTALQVKTPDRALDLLLNRWLLYQTISCRLWGRAAYYQAGGAYGFRDQLQDVMAVVYARPDLARGQLLRAAARQFEEGDVQHWWHPPAGRGTRTRFSDDYLWLPLVAAQYVSVTGDVAVFDEEVPFLHSPPLEAHEHERYELPSVSAQSGSLYEHCRRTLRRAFRLGPHGLPLIGCGDWNDGLNKVGAEGQGESVWVGWFLLVILRRFLPLLEQRGDGELARDLEAQGRSLRQALEREAWDGQWYRRAFFDNGAPLGSSESSECQIDSLAQTWGVFAEANDARVRQAMEAVWERLVRRDEKLVLLFTPPFDNTRDDPGYIKGYLPGIRENGGQYTHAALWVVQAFAMLGDAERAQMVFDLINPVRHALTPGEAERYQIEPYVAAADVYGVAPHTGRGGWSWYTGSASWMYRVAVETLLGFKIEGNRLQITPRVPADWPKFELTYRHGETTCHLVVHNDKDGAQQGMWLDGAPVDGDGIELPTDGLRHEIVVRPRQNDAAQPWSRATESIASLANSGEPA